MLKTKFLAPLLLAAGLLSAHGQILNGSFESPSVPINSVLGIGLLPGTEAFGPGGGITDWSIAGGDVSIVDSAGTLTGLLGLFTPNAGNQFAVLGGLQVNLLGLTLAPVGTVGTLSQSIATTPGTLYTISFDYRGLAVGAFSNNPFLDVSVTNASGSTAPTNATLTASVALGWQADTFSFVATGSDSTLSFFQDASGVNIGDIGLDSVTITPLPEPSQYGAAAVAFLGLLIGGRLLGEKVKVKS
jgi:hypothetical protein